ncbi:MAG: hypothetical protein H6578_00145 [Chitinophagales bacterium]|nr:hypothetical protein [Chitinophagales bacterium]
MNLVNNFYKKYSANFYSDKAWLISKIIFAFYLSKVFIKIIYRATYVNSPLGLCNYIPCSFFLQNEVKIVLIFILIALCVLYIFEIKMLYSLLGLTVITVIIGAVSDSTGVLHRLFGFSLVVVAQLVAYIIFSFKNDKSILSKQRHQFSLQVITCLYFVSFLSKIIHSGPFWFTQYKGFANHILKSWMYKYVTTGNIADYNKGLFFYNSIIEHPYISQFLLLLALILEGFAFLSILNKKISLFWGIALSVMHLSIFILMDIKILSVIIPMLLFILNLPVLLLILIEIIKEKVVYKKINS